MAGTIGGGVGIKAEPNLTPLLDIVLQLLMFFIMCTNFIAEEVSGDIVLPKAQSARPMDKSETDVIFLNIFSDGKVKVLDRRPMNSLETRYWLKERYERTERDSKDGKVNTAVILRAHQDVDYEYVYQALR